MAFAKLSFHGHSDFSDGLDSVEKLVLKAFDLKIDYFGISDHDTLSSIKPLYQEIERLNKTFEHKIIPVTALEFSLVDKSIPTGKEGFDIIFAKPGNLDEEFFSWLKEIKNIRKNCDILKIIKESVVTYNSLVVIPHPGMSFAPSATFSFLKYLSEKLDSEVKRNIGVEVNNWSSKVFLGNKTREKKLEELVKSLGFAQFGFADFHKAEHIGYQYSIVEVDKKTSDNLITAVQSGKVKPGETYEVNGIRWLRLVGDLGHTTLRHRLTKHKKSTD